MEDIIKKYDELYEEMASSKDPMRMMAFGDAEKWVFHAIAEAHPELADKWLSRLEAGKWNNYLSKKEAEEIVAKLINQDGSRGPHWDYETFKSAVEALGGMMSDAPFYNCWALFVTANMRYSDHANSASEFVPKDLMPKFFYDVAVEDLKDIDRPRFIRERYKL